MPSTPDPPDRSHGKDAPTILTDTDATLAEAHSALAQTRLAQERLRFDPHKYREDKQAWAEDVWKGDVTLNEEGARKWFEMCEGEFQVVEGEQRVG
ncbi:hypothetical protein LTS02_017273 [Friedmanniomyces endolithicus]|nr:hypothetical protein LTS02_017273 [Friedmanniomyces endolithicus]